MGLLWADMGVKFDIKRYSAAELALLGIFALGLVLASILGGYRNRIRLSEPIELERSGVSVSLPVSGGWQSMASWVQDPRKEMFTLTGQLPVGASFGAVVQWRFMMSSERLMPEQRLDIRAGDEEVEIIAAGRLSGDVEMVWAHGQLIGGVEDIFLGLASLGRGQVIELEVVTPGDADFAERIFRAVASSLRYGVESFSELRGGARQK
ncbi:MAG: hypothetical protein ACYTFK_11465 [Planctomycetota bacterium]